MSRVKHVWAWIRSGWRVGLTLYLLVASAVVAGIVMRQISGMLGRVEVGGRGNTMSVLTLPHPSPDPIIEAGRAWSEPGPNEVAAALISWHAGIDIAFAILYAALLLWLLRKIKSETWTLVALAVALLADEVENVLTLRFAAHIRDAEEPGAGLAGTMLGFTALKWFALLAVLVGALRALFVLLERQAPLEEGRAADADGRTTESASGATAVRALAAGTRNGGPPATNPPGQRASTVMTSTAARARQRGRVWRRHRVQIAAVTVLGILVALPAGGPLDQIPDILRTYADGKGVRWGELLPSFLTLGLLCLALWVAGRWALLDGLREKPRREQPEETHEEEPGEARQRWRAVHPAVLFLITLPVWVLALVLLALDGPLRFNLGVVALPAVLTVLAVLVLLVRPFGRLRVEAEAPAKVDVPDPDQRHEIRRAGRILAALPVAIAGLGLVRAFVDPLLGYQLETTATGENRLYLALGIITVLIVAPLLYAVLALVEVRILGDRDLVEGHRVVPAVRTWVVHLVGLVVFLAAGVLAALAAWKPITWGSILNATGTVSVFLALVTIVGGGLQWVAERQKPYAPTQRLGFRRRSPLFLVLVATFVVAGLLNTAGGYHAVRLEAREGGTPPTPDLTSLFDDWVTEAAASCTVSGMHAPAGGRAVPLVLVSAPGGGIRAAWWTDRALHKIYERTDCDRRLVFAASGVSGGSVGLVAHYLHAGEAPDADLVNPLAQEEPLAASVAAMFFRDLPAGAFGVSSGWADRARVLESAWEKTGDDWRETRLLQHLQPGPDDNDGWRPLLLLNGTEVSTGCRLVVSPLPVVASTQADAPGSCRSAAVAGNGRGIVEGAVDVTWFRDQQACDGESIRNGDFRASTAALLSARFPYVSPSAELFDCRTRKDRPDDVVRAADLDGGAAENSGLATTLDLWDALEPLVAQHNVDVLDCRAQDEDDEACDPVVVPMLLLVDNHYTSSLTPSPVGRQRELSAPVGIRHAKEVLAEQTVLEQEALVTFSGQLPGHTAGPQSVRFFRIAPINRPGLAAPLGWTLSEATRRDLRTQLNEVIDEECKPGDRDGDKNASATGPWLPKCFLDVVGGPPPKN